MQEIKSSASLELEVLEDAQKKVDRIHKNSALEIEKFFQEQVKIKEAHKEKLTKDYNAKLEFLAHEIENRIELEKKRLELVYVQNSLEKACKEFFASLNRSEVKDCFYSFLKSDTLSTYFSQVNLSYDGFMQTEIEEILSRLKKPISVVSFKQTKIVNTDTYICLESLDKKNSLTITLDLIKDYLLENYRASLSHSLGISGVEV